MGGPTTTARSTYDSRKREVILAELHEALKDGNEKLVGNKGYRKLQADTHAAHYTSVTRVLLVMSGFLA